MIMNKQASSYIFWVRLQLFSWNYLLVGFVHYKIIYIYFLISIFKYSLNTGEINLCLPLVFFF